MRPPRLRRFEMLLIFMMVCVFAAHVIRAWSQPYHIRMIVLAFVIDTLGCVGLIAVCRIPPRAKRPQKPRNELDELLG